MAADPAWIEASVSSYYEYVERIVVSYDQNGKGWTGEQIDIGQCLQRLRAIDRASKMDFRAGHFARPEHADQPMRNDTFQRQTALDQASNGADWVLQLDTDEVIGGPGTFVECLNEAHELGRSAFNYPSIWLYTHAFARYYLESARRGWRRSAGYPGPMAVRAGSILTLARRGPTEFFHVDITERCSPSAVPHGIKVDRVVKSDDAIWHFAMVRTWDHLKRKLATSSHAFDRDWGSEFARWGVAHRHPLWAILSTQLERGPHKRPLRLTRIPLNVESLLNACDLQ